ncbi:tryptophan synthase, alpha chain [Caldicoprobacter faecalis]|jgi:tryptophan synthase, alpha subunit|uniref:Tryptophan synthase alpha chain n=2 Tax=Caldicoprobacteraceae TaxID=715221 RepID=A0A1I5SBI9_9FIRM|nr:tryptophan synthase, alpha chain [Caldicoprobacter faecalis]
MNMMDLTMNRIDMVFNDLREKGSKALITYITAGDPNLGATADLIIEMEKAGADIIELGIPYSDPLADGPVIQRASARALNNGIKIADIMNMVRSVRQATQIPLIYLVYYNSVFKYGIDRFVKEAHDVGIDGIIIPDLPLEERGEVFDITKQYGIHLIPLVAPTSHQRIPKIVENAGGFVYCVSTTGVTGERDEIQTNIKDYMEEVSRYTDMPKAIGFGISNPDMASQLKDYCDGIIIGSAIVSLIEKAASRDEMLDSVYRFIRGVKRVL